jgi:hypothetical protein
MSHRGTSLHVEQPLFMTRHQTDGTTFEFKVDAHWNAIGHEIAANALLLRPPEPRSGLPNFLG